MKIKDVLYLPSGRIFILETDDGYAIEATEMRDVSVDGKQHCEVRESQDPHIIWNHLVPYEEKWLLTVSTQKGCNESCQFCDVAKLPFRGNLTREEITGQIQILLHSTYYVQKCNKVKIGFARMGEPAYNLDNVLKAMGDLKHIAWMHGREFNWLPCFNTILPRKVGSRTGFDIIDEVIEFKESAYKGFLHFQISSNSTDESKRKELFGGADVLTLEEIVAHIKSKTITNRTVTLNFIVMDGVEVDVDKLKRMGLNGDQFTVKLIPLNKTKNANDHSLETYANYSNYEKLQELGKRFNAIGVPTVIDAIAKCEEAGLCCGQLAQIYL